jgi:hypothetical protein
MREKLPRDRAAGDAVPPDRDGDAQRRVGAADSTSKQKRASKAGLVRAARSGNSAM